MEKLQGVVERITYANEEKGYSVIKIRVKGYTDLVTLVGNMASVNIGSIVIVTGKWTHNPKYGKQFGVDTWEETIPATVYGLERYLGSGLIRGIGPKYAKRIVNHFKESTINIIENEPHRLIEVPNIGRKRVESITSAWAEQKEIKNIMLFLQEHGVSTAYGHRIYKAYGEKGIAVVTQNPYQLADDVFGIGFKTADKIAIQLGIDKESFSRCRAGIFYVLNDFANNGHCYAYFQELVEKSVEILEIEEPKIVMTISHLINEKELITEDEDKVFLPPFYYSESGTARRISAIQVHNNSHNIKNIDETLKELQEKWNIVYEQSQIDAINLSVTSKFVVITGGPGTGKTTITRSIVSIYARHNKSVVLAAPTGRAAKRMSEVCGVEAKTIHRLLESSPIDGYGRNQDNPLDGDILILDETSMVDILLMYNLLKAVPDKMNVILVGDADQLPSVGAGNVLQDIITSNTVPVIRLTQIFRQAESSRIISNAHLINHSKMPVFKGGKNEDCFFIEHSNDDTLLKEIVELCSARLPKYYNADPIKDIQVLAPMKRGTIGTDNLNRILQDVLNKNTIKLYRGATEYRIKDKVLQVKNNYEKNVFNGDIGYIDRVDLINKNLSVDFDGNLVQYDILELDELVLAYAMTIHKSQGGEFPIVVMPITFSHYPMLAKNLLYTGVTRAKKALILLGNKEAIGFAVKKDTSIRNTSLDEKLQTLIHK